MTTEPLLLTPDCLAVFIDDTGHEQLKGHPIYGLGGCAVMGSDYQRVIINPWRRRRQGRYGTATAPMHAVEYGRGATRANLTAMNRFFANQPFFRFAAIATNATQYPTEAVLMRWVMHVLKQRIVEVINRTPARSVAVIFEASDRANKLVVEHFGSLELTEEGQPVPVEHGFMPKTAREPGLEVADFVVHTVGRYARHWINGRPGFPPDFIAMFHRCDPRLQSFLLVDRIELGAPVTVPAPVARELLTRKLSRSGGV